MKDKDKDENAKKKDESGKKKDESAKKKELGGKKKQEITKKRQEDSRRIRYVVDNNMPSTSSGSGMGRKSTAFFRPYYKSTLSSSSSSDEQTKKQKEGSASQDKLKIGDVGSSKVRSWDLFNDISISDTSSTEEHQPSDDKSGANRKKNPPKPAKRGRKRRSEGSVRSNSLHLGFWSEEEAEQNIVVAANKRTKRRPEDSVVCNSSLYFPTGFWCDEDVEKNLGKGRRKKRPEDSVVCNTSLFFPTGFWSDEDAEQNLGAQADQEDEGEEGEKKESESKRRRKRK